MNAHLNYSFDDYRLDPAKRELWLGDELVPLQPKAFECIVYLVQNRDRAVGKDELISAVWGDVDATDRVVSLAISRARQAIGDTGDEHQIIRTITRVGYCWVMPVDEIEIAPPGNGHANGHPAEFETTQTPAGNPQTDPPVTGDHERPAGRRPRGFVFVAGGLALLVAVVIAALTVQPDPAAVAPVEGEVAVVLPVTVIGDDGASWIRLGVMDLIADHLRAAGQTVAPSDNTVALARDLNGQAQPDPAQLRAIAQAAAAGLIMNAQAERIDNHWRVTLSTLHGRKPALTASGDASDIFVAAHAAADRMGILLGHALEKNDEEVISDLDRIILRARAAILSDHLEEARSLLEGVGKHERDDPRVRLYVARVTMRSGEAESAEKEFRALLQSTSSEATPLMHAHALQGIGVALYRQLDPAAERWLTQAAHAFEKLDSFEARNALGRTYMNRASVHSGLHRDLQAAHADFARARVAFQDTADQLALAQLDANTAILFTRQNRYSDALPLAQRAVAAMAAFGDVQNELRGRIIVAVSHMALANMPAASEEVQHFDRLFAKIADPWLETAANYYRVSIWHHSGRIEAARELLEDELYRLRAAGRKSDLAEWEGMAAGHALRQGHHDRAVSFARSAVEALWNDPVMEPELARAWLVLVRAQLLSDDFAGAATSYVSALEWAETTEDEAVQLVVLILQAEYAAALGDLETAREHFQSALEIADKSSVPIDILGVADLYARRLIENGELDQASIVTGRITSWAATNFDAALLQVRLHHALGNITAWRTALANTRNLAGEREIPPDLLNPPTRQRAIAAETNLP